MRKSIKDNQEEIQILSFAVSTEGEPGTSEINTMKLFLPADSGNFAVAAMLKGYREFFLKPVSGEEQFPAELLGQVEHNLKIWSGMAEPKSKLIL